MDLGDRRLGQAEVVVAGAAHACRRAASGSRSSRAGCRAPPPARATERLPPQCAQRWASGSFSPAHFGQSMRRAMMTDGARGASIAERRAAARCARRRARPRAAAAGGARVAGRSWLLARLPRCAGRARARRAARAAGRSRWPGRWPWRWPLARRAARAAGGRRPPRLLFAPGAVRSWWRSGSAYTPRLRVSGDEPHYLLMAQSLWRERDLDLRDNLAREDWREYTPGPVAPHYGAPRRDGRPFPAHSPGLPLLLAPVYALGGRPPVRGRCWRWPRPRWRVRGVRALARRLTGDAEAALAGLGRWPRARPSLFYAFHVYTEVPSALALAVGARACCSPRPTASAAARRPRRCCASALPWLHVKMIPAAAALAVIAASGAARARARGLPRPSPWPGASLSWPTTHAIFGVGRRRSRSTAALPRDAERLARCARSPASLLDRSFGLLPYAPVFLLALAGLAAPRPLARRGASPALRRRGRGRARAGLAHVVGRPVPAGALPRPAGARPGPGRGRARGPAPARACARWRWPLAAAGLRRCARSWRSVRARLLLLNRGDRPTRLWAALSGDARPCALPAVAGLGRTPDEWRVLSSG